MPTDDRTAAPVPGGKEHRPGASLMIGGLRRGLTREQREQLVAEMAVAQGATTVVNGKVMVPDQASGRWRLRPRATASAAERRLPAAKRGMDLDLARARAFALKAKGAAK